MPGRIYPPRRPRSDLELDDQHDAYHFPYMPAAPARRPIDPTKVVFWVGAIATSVAVWAAIVWALTEPAL